MPYRIASNIRNLYQFTTRIPTGRESHRISRYGHAVDLQLPISRLGSELMELDIIVVSELLDRVVYPFVRCFVSWGEDLAVTLCGRVGEAFESAGFSQELRTEEDATELVLGLLRESLLSVH